VDFRPALGAAVPPDLNFRDEHDSTVRLDQLFAGKPVILALVYYACPMLCDQVLHGLARSLRAVSLKPGKDYRVIAVSFDPSDTAATALEKRDDLAGGLRSKEAGSAWHFLTGRQKEITALTQSLGFRYSYDAMSRTFAHAGGILVLTPHGTVSRYFYGVDYAPRDLQLALMDASDGKVGSVLDRVLLFCYEYDPATGRYSAAVLRLVRWGGIVSVTGLAIFLLLLRSRDMSRRLSLRDEHESSREQ
jgi:protein SCO1/2